MWLNKRKLNCVKLKIFKTLKCQFYINNWTLDHPVALLIEEAASKSIKIFLFLSLIWQMTVEKMMFWYIWRFSVERWSFLIVIMVFTATTQLSQIVCEIAIKFLCMPYIIKPYFFEVSMSLGHWTIGRVCCPKFATN